MPRRLVALLAAGALTAACSSGPPLVLRSHLPSVARHLSRLGHHDPAPRFPADLVTGHDAPCARTPLAPGWVGRENALPGTTDWRPAPSSAVELYVDDPSIACGDHLQVRLGGSGARGVVVRVLRVGWYGGRGAREVWRSGPLAVPRSPEPRVRDHVVPDAAWATTVTATVTRSWTPGLYLAEPLVHGRPRGAAAFVVRNDATPSPLVTVHSDLTWAAYSDAGGASLYRGPVHGQASHAAVVAARAWSVSLLRPTTGSGLTQLLANDLPLARLTDRLGLATDHVVDTDLEVRPSVVRGHAGLLLPGHAEYWTRRAYDALQALEGSGVNVADLGANALYWQARVTHDGTGRPLSSSVYRTLALDPEATAHPDLATVRWQDRPLERPSSAVVGESYAAAFDLGGLVLHDPPAWLVAGTDGRDGTVLPGVVLNEADGARAADAAAPARLQVVADGVLLGTPTVLVSTGYASLPSGAGVFDAGTTTWLCAIDDSCPQGRVFPSTSQLLLGLTANVLHAFGEPRWGARHAARSAVPASVAALLPTLPHGAVGRHGRGD